MRSSTPPPRGFTLIELLVVIAIIAILSAIVLASLNSARERGREAAIRSILKNMSQQIELMRDDNPNYSFVNDCTTNGLKQFADALKDQGAAVSCQSFTATNHIYTTWAVTAEIVGTPELTAWSVSTNGVVKWDTTDASSVAKDWETDNGYCTDAGKRTATSEMLWTIADISNPVYPPRGFQGTIYWSDILNPANEANGWGIQMLNGLYGGTRTKETRYFVRCVS